MTSTEAREPANDWLFLVGRWHVRHTRLKERLVGSTTWETFDGTCVNWTTMGGLGNVDDNVLELPGGTYRAVSVRAFDATEKLWSIWWIDSRQGSLDPPVRGRFENGTGTFLGRDSHLGTPVLARFRWTGIDTDTPRWEQAFSVDEGTSWETNWYMDFTRATG